MEIFSKNSTDLILALNYVCCSVLVYYVYRTGLFSGYYKNIAVIVSIILNVSQSLSLVPNTFDLKHRSLCTAVLAGLCVLQC